MINISDFTELCEGLRLYEGKYDYYVAENSGGYSMRCETEVDVDGNPVSYEDYQFVSFDEVLSKIDELEKA